MAGISQPIRAVLLTPASVVLHGIEGAMRGVAENRFESLH
jgi:hypothetical protein